MWRAGGTVTAAEGSVYSPAVQYTTCSSLPRSKRRALKVNIGITKFRMEKSAFFLV